MGKLAKGQHNAGCCTHRTCLQPSRVGKPSPWGGCLPGAVVPFAMAHFLQDFSPRLALEWLQAGPVLFAPSSCPASALAAEIGVLLQSSGVARGLGLQCSLQGADGLPGRFSQALTGTTCALY